MTQSKDEIRAKDLITIDEALILIDGQRTPATITGWCRDQKIKAYKPGGTGNWLIDCTDFERFIRAPLPPDEK